MNEPTQNILEQEKEALKFLERDFNQSFQQMRHYDAQLFDTLKFMFTAYSALIGVSLGLYQFGLKENKYIALPAIAALIVGLIFGLLMFALTIRNRVYFVQIARYINEQRGFFFKYKPMGFENKSRMYTNHEQPPYFNWRSSQTVLYGTIATLNSSLFGILLFIGFSSDSNRWSITLSGYIILFIIQSAGAIWYLRSRENKSASRAVFGKE